MSATCVRGVSVDDRNNQIAGCAFAVLQAVLYSTMGILGKLLYATGMDSQQVVILRFLCSSGLCCRSESRSSRFKLMCPQRTGYNEATAIQGGQSCLSTQQTCSIPP